MRYIPQKSRHIPLRDVNRSVRIDLVCITYVVAHVDRPRDFTIYVACCRHVIKIFLKEEWSKYIISHYLLTIFYRYINITGDSNLQKTIFSVTIYNITVYFLAKSLKILRVHETRPFLLGYVSGPRVPLQIDLLTTCSWSICLRPYASSVEIH